MGRREIPRMVRTLRLPASSNSRTVTTQPTGTTADTGTGGWSSAAKVRCRVSLGKSMVLGGGGRTTADYCAPVYAAIECPCDNRKQDPSIDDLLPRMLYPI